jgi:hypothetical protein
VPSLYLDEDLAPELARILRSLGYDAITTGRLVATETESPASSRATAAYVQVVGDSAALDPAFEAAMECRMGSRRTPMINVHFRQAVALTGRFRDC